MRRVLLSVLAAASALAARADALTDFWDAVPETPVLRRLPVAILPENAFIRYEDALSTEQHARFVDDLAARSTYNLLTVTPRWKPETTDPETIALTTTLVARAHAAGIQFHIDVDPRAARRAFFAKHPEDRQRALFVLTSTDTPAGQDIPFVPQTRDDHMVGPRPAYTASDRRLVSTTNRADGVRVDVVEYAIAYPDLWSDAVASFPRETVDLYRSLGVDGAMRDEWGFPPPYPEMEHQRAFWYSEGFASAYRAFTGGGELAKDVVLMALGEPGRERARAAAFDAYNKLLRQRCAFLEKDHYDYAKRVFGADTYVTKHATWFPEIGWREMAKNGLVWWEAKRDWAQADELTPVPAVLGMMRLSDGPCWMNEGYDVSCTYVARHAWQYALFGGRMVWHWMYPHDGAAAGMSAEEDYRRRHMLMLDDPGCRAVQRATRLVNLISRAKPVSAVAFFFGRDAVMNPADPAYLDWGRKAVYGLWRKGYLVDLYPADYIRSEAFKLDKDGYFRIGDNAYRAVVLHHVDPSARAHYLARAARSSAKTKLFDTAAHTVEDIAAALAKTDAVRQTPCVPIRGEKQIQGRWEDMFPPADGTLELTDGTKIRIRAKDDLRGDFLDDQTLDFGGDKKIRYSARGLFAARFGADGRPDAVCGAGVTRLAAPGGFEFTDARGVDFALVRHFGEWRGVFQAPIGTKMPNGLKALAAQWTHLVVPGEAKK